MKFGLYGFRKGHKSRIFILLFSSLLPALPGVGSRLLKSKIKIRFSCPFLRPYKPDFIFQHLYQDVKLVGQDQCVINVSLNLDAFMVNVIIQLMGVNVIQARFSLPATQKPQNFIK